MTSSRNKPLTYPSPKYGPTPDYGRCELDDEHAARSTCPVCEGHFCLAHAEHTTHSKAMSG